jgi:hypothetical protein
MADEEKGGKSGLIVCGSLSGLTLFFGKAVDDVEEHAED